MFENTPKINEKPPPILDTSMAVPCNVSDWRVLREALYERLYTIQLRKLIENGKLQFKKRNPFQFLWQTGFQIYLFLSFREANYIRITKC